MLKLAYHLQHEKHDVHLSHPRVVSPDFVKRSEKCVLMKVILICIFSCGKSAQTNLEGMFKYRFAVTNFVNYASSSRKYCRRQGECVNLDPEDTVVDYSKGAAAIRRKGKVN